MSDAVHYSPVTRSNPFGLLVRISLGLALADLFVWPFFEQVPLAAAVFVAQLGLAAVWLAFGRVALPWRLLGAGVQVLLVGVPLVWRGGPSVFASLYCATLLAAIPGCVARIAGWEVRLPAVLDKRHEPEASRGPGQFTLRQMFAWTTAAAMIAGFIRFMGPPPALSALAVAGVAILFGVLLVATVWSALGDPSPWGSGATRIRLCALVSFVVVTFGAYWRWGELTKPLVIGLFGPATILLIAFVLLILRAAGFRYVRVQRAPPTTREQLKSTPQTILE